MTTDYETQIRLFIEKLNALDLNVTVHQASTVVCGDYDVVFSAITTVMREALNEKGRSAIILKVMNTE